MIALKICGVTDLAQAQEIAQCGIDYLGFICVPVSPRYRDPEIFAAILATIRKSLDLNISLLPRFVGVFANANPAELESIQNQVRFDVLQLHGQESPQFCRWAKEQFPQCQIWKAFRVREAQDLHRIQDYETIVDGILLDAYHPQQLGGTGKTFDWSILGHFQPRLPWFLAGGLTPDNVKLALQTVLPFGLDVSSGVERSPGDKDLTLVNRLITVLHGYASESMKR